MAYTGSEAYRLDYGAQQRARQEERHAPFSVVEGDGLDARARQGVSRLFLGRVSLFAAAFALFAALGLCRVAISAATIGCLSSNGRLESSITAAQKLNGELQMERSVLSSSARIDQIATQLYGMVYPVSTDSITVTSADESAQGGQPSADAAQSAPAEEGAPAES